MPERIYHSSATKEQKKKTVKKIDANVEKEPSRTFPNAKSDASTPIREKKESRNNNKLLDRASPVPQTKTHAEKSATPITKNPPRPEHVNSGAKTPVSSVDTKENFLTKSITAIKNGEEPPFRMYDNPPDRPDADGGTMSAESEVEERKMRIIYQGVTEAIIGCVESIKQKLPNNASIYDLIIKAILNSHDADPTEPWRMWVNAVGDHAYVLRDCTEENINKFLELSQDVELLKVLEIGKYFHLFTEEDIRILWDHFAEITMVVTAASLPIALLTALEDMTVRVVESGKMNHVMQGDSIDLMAIYNTAEECVNADSGVQKQLQLLQKNSQNAIPEPPMFSKKERGFYDAL